MKNSDEKVNVGAFRDAQKQYLGGWDYSHVRIITKMNHPTFSKQTQFSRPNYLGAWNRLGLIRQKLCHYYQVRE